MTSSTSYVRTGFTQYLVRVLEKESACDIEEPLIVGTQSFPILHLTVFITSICLHLNQNAYYSSQFLLVFSIVIKTRLTFCGRQPFLECRKDFCLLSRYPPLEVPVFFRYY